MKKIEAIIRPEKLEEVKQALSSIGIVGLNVTQVTGRGVQKGISYQGRGGQLITVDMLSKIKLETVVRDEEAEKVIQAILMAARTGKVGDGKIFVSPVEQVIRVRTGERGTDAL